ncbi:MAG: RES domain-containing protein [Methylophilaceae bacterium]|nr:RES domain-containing protein [Methylophilaceae bacterium]
MAYRAHHPMWSFDPLSGEGAKKHGGRFNRPGCAALYLSLDPTTAWMEAQQGFPFKPQPMTLVAYEIDCTKIADLNDEALLKRLGFSSQDLACAWEAMAAKKQEPATWQLVNQLRSLDVAGILVRSFASACNANNQNLVLWDWSDSAPNAVRLIDDFDRLPRTMASWSGSKPA